MYREPSLALRLGPRSANAARFGQPRRIEFRGMSAPDRSTAPISVRHAQWLNLMLPGGGMVLLGDIAGVLAIGLAFAAAANLAVVSTFLIPDDFAPSLRILTVLAAALAYIARRHTGWYDPYPRVDGDSQRDPAALREAVMASRGEITIDLTARGCRRSFAMLTWRPVPAYEEEK